MAVYEVVTVIVVITGINYTLITNTGFEIRKLSALQYNICISTVMQTHLISEDFILSYEGGTVQFFEQRNKTTLFQTFFVFE